MQGNVRQGFAIRLTELMRLHKVSQSQAAAWVGVGQSTVSDWTRGITSPPIDQATILADRLGVSLDYLVGRKSDDERINAWTPEERSAAELTVLVLRHGVEETKKRIQQADSPPEPTEAPRIGRAPASNQPVPVRHISKPDKPPRSIQRAPATNQPVPVRRIGRHDEEK